MKRILIEVSDEWHRIIRTEAAMRGMTTKDFILVAVMEFIKNESRKAKTKNKGREDQQ